MDDKKSAAGCNTNKKVPILSSLLFFESCHKLFSVFLSLCLNHFSILTSQVDINGA